MDERDGGKELALAQAKERPGRTFRRSHVAGASLRPQSTLRLTDRTSMAPTNKAQAAGVSAGSFLELRAQVAKQKESLIKGKATAVAGRKKEGKVRSISTLEPLHLSRDNLLALTEANQMGTRKQRR